MCFKLVSIVHVCNISAYRVYQLYDLMKQNISTGCMDAQDGSHTGVSPVLSHGG